MYLRTISKKETKEILITEIKDTIREYDMGLCDIFGLIQDVTNVFYEFTEWVNRTTDLDEKEERAYAVHNIQTMRKTCIEFIGNLIDKNSKEFI